MFARLDLGRGPWRGIRLATALEALTITNRRIRAAAERAGHPLPRLLASGVRYRAEEGAEEWQHVAELFATGQGDCEDLACALAAEIPGAWPAYYSRERPSGARLYHVVTRLSDGSILDPSRRLGM